MKFSNILHSREDDEKAVVKPVKTDDKEVPVADPTVDKDHVKKQKEQRQVISTKDGETFVDTKHKDYFRKDDESAQDYNERVPVSLQPVGTGDSFDYLGRKRD